MCKKAPRSSLAMEAERRCLEDPVRCKQGNNIEAVGEELQRQAVMLASAIGDALDAVDKNKGRRCLDLEAALANYETVFFRHERVADADACASAKRARRILEDSWEEAMDKLEALAEVQAEEVGDIKAKLQKESGAKVELGEFGVVEQLADEDKLVEEFGIKEVEKFGAKPLVDSGEQVAKVEVGMEETWTWKEVKVKQDLGGMLCGKLEVEETRIDEDGQEFRATKDDSEFRAAKNELQELRIPESSYEEEFGAEFELQVPEIEPRRFVTAGCRGQSTNSEYG